MIYRFNDLNIAWKALFESRWPEGSRQIQPMNCLTNQDGVARCDFTIHSGNWQQMYWEMHLQKYVYQELSMVSLNCLSFVKVLLLFDQMLKLQSQIARMI